MSSEPVISNSQWEQAKKKLMEVYFNSTCLENILNMLYDFEKIYPIKYKSDLMEFINESQYEDFYENIGGSVYVSTIHKSKGREFENVYMMLHNVTAVIDEDRRKLYVAMTRAKNNVYIHYDNTLFDNIDIESVQTFYDSTEYPQPREIALQLTHRDVFLNSFKNNKSNIFKLHSGSELYIRNGNLEADLFDKRVTLGRLSQACIERLRELEIKGYYPYKAEVRFIVAWKGEDAEEEIAVILPNIYLNRG